MIVQTPTLVGSKVRLRPVEERDMPLFVRWFNDPDVRHWLASSERPPFTVEGETEKFHRAQTDDSVRDWIIETLDGRAIGNAGVNKIDRLHGLADFYITIGEKDCWSQGYGTDAVRVVLAECFEGMGLRRIQLWTDSDNVRGHRVYEKCGFVREGVLRHHRLRYGKAIDTWFMAVLREEWQALR